MLQIWYIAIITYYTYVVNMLIGKLIRSDKDSLNIDL